MESPQDLLNKIWREVQLADQRRQLEAIRKDPAAHRYTRIMDGTANYRWCHGPIVKKTQRKHEHIKFCFAIGKNAAGVYLFWKQIETHARKNGKWRHIHTQRSEWRWAPTKREACEITRRRAARALEEAGTP